MISVQTLSALNYHITILDHANNIRSIKRLLSVDFAIKCWKNQRHVYYLHLIEFAIIINVSSVWLKVVIKFSFAIIFAMDSEVNKSVCPV